MSLPYNQEMIARARELRKDMTPQERKLWYQYLREYPVRFQRQKTIKSFIADFYCHKAKLIVEVDGSQHYTDQGLAYDQERTNILKEYNLEVIRFSNYDINMNFESVCMEIDKKSATNLFAGRPRSTPSVTAYTVPPPSRREVEKSSLSEGAGFDEVKG